MSSARTLPPWLKKRLPPAQQTRPVRAMLAELGLNTVCREAHCPNRGECYASGTATFMILGAVCTRNCRFCAVAGGKPEPPDADEPQRVAEAARRLGLRHVVVTSVTRDDLPDGGSDQFAATIRALHRRTGATVEVLTPDFGGEVAALERVLDAEPEVFNHNVETVPRLYPGVRPEADYRRSLAVLNRAAGHKSVPAVKSGMMLGLGETGAEVRAVLDDLLSAGCRAVTVGQYLAPSSEHHPVVEFIPPAQFDALRREALEMGFDAAVSGPFVRSSYKAAEMAEQLLNEKRRQRHKEDR
ncbi:MAG: lipoyl synthase [Candidatus Brocadiia bacterium]